MLTDPLLRGLSRKPCYEVDVLGSEYLCYLPDNHHHQSIQQNDNNIWEIFLKCLSFVSQTLMSFLAPFHLCRKLLSLWVQQWMLDAEAVSWHEVDSWMPLEPVSDHRCCDWTPCQSFCIHHSECKLRYQQDQTMSVASAKVKVRQRFI